jgi:predicted AlkP superfamily pyrophosphatase or phosphodiesterase
MIDETIKLLQDFRRHSRTAKMLAEDMIFPAYEGGSLSNVSDSICRWLGVPQRGTPLNGAYHRHFTKEYQHILLFVLDGLGLKMLEKTIHQDGKLLSQHDWDDLLGEAVLYPLTSVAPSTTASALTSLWTGSTPGEHGIVGYEVWLKEYSLVANMIKHTPVSFTADIGGLGRAGFQASQFVPVQPISVHFKAHGVQPVFFIEAGLAQSGLTVMHMPEAKVQPYYSLEDARLTLEEMGSQVKDGQKTFTAVYWPLIDTLSHRYGPENERIQLELEQFFHTLRLFLDSLRKKGNKNTLVLLTADHGLTSTPVDPQYDLKNHPELFSMLAMQPTGESRLPHFYVRAGKETRFLDYMHSHWNNTFYLISADELVESGILGSKNFHPALKDRLGDWMAIPRNGAYLWWKPYENVMLGRHGGLSEEEMLIPLLGWEF